ncbi:MAG: sugar phosphate isomerase/epimerase [Planctomycetes bacterium]|nr:sugar phosphate isomerase/epimerase [Planctomycetota bacterium]
MKWSFTTLGCPDWTLEQIAANAKAHGYHGVELRTHQDGNHLSPDAPAGEVRAVAEMFEKHGVSVMSVMGYSRFAFLDGDEVRRNQDLVRKLIPIAVALGARHIRTFAGQVPKGQTTATMLPILADALRPLAAEAARAGVAMETHDDWCASDVLVKLARAIASPKGFGIVWDVCNCIQADIEPWRASYRRLKPLIRYCHVKDGYVAADGSFQYAALGAGDLPWVDVVKVLRTDRFKGYLSFEWEKKWHPELEPPERVFPQYTHKMASLLAAKKR